MQSCFMILPYLCWFQGKKEFAHEMRFKKESRYYVLRLEQDLLGDWVIQAINGRIKSKLGQSRTHAYDNYQNAFEGLCLLVKIRCQRKYNLQSYKIQNELFWLSLVCLLNTLNFNAKSPTQSEEKSSRGKKKKTCANLSISKSNSSHNSQISFDF